MTYEALQARCWSAPCLGFARLHGCSGVGIDGVLMELNCGGKIRMNVMTALRLLCQEVMPTFH